MNSKTNNRHTALLRKTRLALAIATVLGIPVKALAAEIELPRIDVVGEGEQHRRPVTRRRLAERLERRAGGLHRMRFPRRQPERFLLRQGQFAERQAWQLRQCGWGHLLPHPDAGWLDQ